jgi:glycosyltransferase involved in cell wall biosynthesis
MRIACLAHFYPPAPCGGAGYWTAMLAEGFRAHGHEVGVLCVDKWGEGRKYLNGQEEDCQNGVPVRRLLVNWRKAPRPFDWLFDSPVLGLQTAVWLQQFKPDILHVSSAYTLSARPVIVAKEMGLPVVLHQHDYWFICARAFLQHKDGRICSGPESPWKCQQCLLQGTQLWRLTSGVVPRPVRQRFFRLLARSSWATRQRSARGMLGDLQARRQTTMAALEAADALVTPTTYARRILEAGGAPPGRILVMPYGSTWAWTKDLRRTEASHLRVGFLGNLFPFKGAHLLVAAYKSLRAAGFPLELQIWGDGSVAPDYYETLRRGAPDEIVWGGLYSRADLARILGGLDVIVVPALLHETQGIVIQEAFAARLPVIVSAGTSLTESITPEVNGLLFQQGSSQDLARQLRRLLDEPALLERLRAAVPPVRSIEEDVRELGGIYCRLAGRPDGALS